MVVRSPWVTSTLQSLQFPAGLSASLEQRVGIWMPSAWATSRMVLPSSALIFFPLMVIVIMICPTSSDGCLRQPSRLSVSP